MRHFHVPGVFDLKTELMIAGAALGDYLRPLPM